MATKVKRPTKARPDVFDMVEGVNQNDLRATDALIAEVTKNIKNLERKRLLLMHQRAAQQIEITGVDTQVGVATVTYSKSDKPAADWSRTVKDAAVPAVGQEPAETSGARS